METLKKVFNFYINSSIHVALAITALIKLTFLKFQVLGDDVYLYFGFTVSVVAYNFIKYTSITELHHRKKTLFMSQIKIITAISGLFCVYFGSQLSLDIWLYVLPFGVLTILFGMPIFPNRKNLLNVASIKIFIIGLVWTGITAIIPFVYIEGGYSFDMIIETIQRFIFVIVLMLPFEIRNLQYDVVALETIPQKIGITKTKVFGGGLLVVFLLLTAIKDDLLSAEILSTISVTMISLLFLWGTEKKQSAYFSSFWVLGIPMIWLLSFFLLEKLFG